MFFKTNNNIPMIPYPSGRIHIGHFRNYMINDIYNRFLFLINYKSKMLISWDAFGTPAENASLKNNMFPINYLKNNIFFMKKQLKSSYLSILWQKEFKTSDVNYYLFNQMLIFKLIKNNLLYISNKKINWDECDKTVLSNEQVIKGLGWRSSCIVYKKNILTYYFKINYAINEIYKEIENLDWPDRVKIMQKNWIFNINFYYYFYFNFFRKKMKKIFFLKNFFSFFHFFSKKLIFLNRINKLLNSGNFISNIYLNMKVEFWFFKKKKFYFLNYKNISLKYFYLKKLYINIRYKFKALTILEFLILFKIKKFIILKIKLKIKDWGISRQRYWGFPIPIYYCEKCKRFYNSFKHFPILISKNLKNNINYFKTLNNLIECEFCGSKSFKENSTGDTFIDSSWYFLKYFKKNYEYNLVFPIDLYVGGIEHAILHLLYSRYIFKILRNLKYLNFGEPVKKLFSQGIILNKVLKFKKSKIEKMSKSKNNIVTPDEISKNYSIDSLRISILKNPFKKNFIWREYVIKNSNSFFKNIFKKLNLILKEKFFKTYFFFYKYKIIYKFIINNLKNFLYLIKKIYYDRIIILLFKIFKIINFKKIFNVFIIKDIYFKILKNFFVFFPSIIIKFWKLLKFKNILKINFKEFYFKILLKNSYKLKKIIILINNKMIGIFALSKLKKKKIFNFIFFKKKIFKKNIYKIIFINNSIEIIA
ncbi:leucyl-tRNA synthetase [Candidatus Nasuia deltocephalinicola str. NAS-ALF]|uniref:leucine--tRNA ligase n=1 Tax=Candidatus Nasuia deltocephalinicola str. NAS-ALF TaxID=1343077 RepID=S5SY68_9PROT|nr:leucyl-tRNA synthetase [Candidatus Nasuia deltocephalinicola str. NAS-ALF]